MHMPENTGGNFTPPPAGTHMAVCYRVIDLGTQQGQYMGQAKRQRKIVVSWELSDEKMEDGRPFTVHQRYTLSSHEKSRLRQDLEAWRGAPFKDSDFGPDGFHLAKLLDVPCMLTIIHEAKDGNTYANIRAIAKPPKGFQASGLTNEKAYFSFEDFSPESFARLPQRIQDTIKKSPEYAEAVNGMNAREDRHDEHPPLSDDIPF